MIREDAQGELLRPTEALQWNTTDRLLTLLLALIAIVFTFKTVHWNTAPSEDSLMLLRYTNHLVSGAGITWNVGDPPVEGATDFLYMVILAGCMKIFHGGAITTSRILLLLCHGATVALVFAGGRKLFEAGRPFALALAIYLMLGPGALLAASSFSGPLYGLAAMGAWWFACAMVHDAVTQRRLWLFALLALMAGLIRPDGVVLAIIITLTLCYGLISSGRRTEALRSLGLVSAVFVILGGAYFLWRFHYFGYLLPNPFYKKGGGHLYPDSLHRSVYNMVKMLLPVLPLAILAMMLKETRRRTLFVFATPFFFSLIWILLTNENNWYMRFQYVAIPLTLMSIPYITNALEHRFPNALHFDLTERFGSWSVLALTATLTVLVGGTYWKTLYDLPMRENGSGAYNIARGLHQWKDRHYTMVLTEAGVIPYFSDWRVIDAWGLNDSHIVHDKRGLTPEYLDTNHPAIIMFHLANRKGIADYQDIWRGDAPLQQNPSVFMNVLAHYAVAHNYVLAARWGDSPCNIHVWYVQRDLPEAAAMIDEIRRAPHFFLDSQAPAFDYRDAPPPTACEDPGISIPAGS